MEVFADTVSFWLLVRSVQSNLTWTWFAVSHTFSARLGIRESLKKGNFWLPRIQKEWDPDFKTLADYVIPRNKVVMFACFVLLYFWGVAAIYLIVVKGQGGWNWLLWMEVVVEVCSLACMRNWEIIMTSKRPLSYALCLVSNTPSSHS